MRHYIASAKTLAMLVASVLIIACGSPTGPTTNPPPPPPEVTVKSVTLVVDQSSVTEGGSTLVHITANKSDGTSVDVTSAASVNAQPSTVVTVSSGQLTGVKAGDAMLTATYSGVSSTPVKVTVVPPAPTPSLLTVSPQSPVTIGSPPIQYQAVEKFSDGTLKDVSFTATWSSSDASVATITTSGQLTALKAGTVTIRASKDGLKDSTSLTVLPAPPVGVPWSQFGQISDGAKALVQAGNLDFNINGKTKGAIFHWLNGSVIKVYADPGFRMEDVLTMENFWSARVDVTYQNVSTPAEADVVFTFDSSITDPNICGGEGPDSVVNNRIVHGHGRYSPRQECLLPNGSAMLLLTHGMGHILGLEAHTTPAGTDIMSSPPPPTLKDSSILNEYFKFLYSVPVGTILI